jgi:hypothetical protein
VAHYCYEKFRKLCHKKKVIVLDNALRRAYEDFRLKEEKDVLVVIANERIEQLKFNRTEPHTKIDDTLIDSYLFRYRGISGYLAFFCPPSTGQWVIKSFHRSKEANPMLKDKLIKALQERREKGERNE